MTERNRYVGLGIFVLVGLILFSAGLFLIGNRRMLFEDNFEIWTEFATITGLQDGAIVRVSGKDSGEVTSIEVPRTPDEKFRIRLRIVEQVHPLIRTDSVASIQTDGLVGNKFLSITVGTTEAPVARAGSTIPGREPFEFADLLQQTSETMQTANETVKYLRDDIEKTLKIAADTVAEVQLIMKDAGGDVRGIASSGNKIAADLSVMVSDIRQGKGALGKFVRDDSVYENVDGLAEEARLTAQNIRMASEKANQIISDFQQKSSKGGFTQQAQGTLTNLNEVLTDMADNTEALKRNFFFRGFFQRRGYYDLDEISVSDYKAGVLSKARYEKKIWLETKDIFEPGTQETLSEDGKNRVTDTIKALFQYQNDPVFIIEGYASQGTAADQYLHSRQRAVQVRNYVLSQFPIPSEAIAIMPLGLKINQLTSQTWDGVALVIYYLPEESSTR